MASTTIIKANKSFTFVGSNGPISIAKGKTFHRESQHLAGISVEALEQNFDPFVPDFDNEIEQATAAPGEKRTTRIRKSKPESTDTPELSELKQPELKALLDKRGIEYPTGVVSNADLIALLESKPESAE